MLGKDIYHEILLYTNIHNLVNTYLAFKPYYAIEYYIDKLVRRKEHEGEVWYYISFPQYISDISDYITGYIMHTGSLYVTYYNISLRANRLRKCGVAHNTNGPAVITRGWYIWYKYGELKHMQSKGYITDLKYE